jgi:hypothetical protein
MFDFKPWTQEDVERFREERENQERLLRRQRCPWCNGQSFRTYDTNGRKADSCISQSLKNDIRHIDGRYWHHSCVLKYRDWREEVSTVWAELAWHIKIDLTCCPKPVYKNLTKQRKTRKPSKSRKTVQKTKRKQ